MGSKIREVKAREVLTERGHPGVEANAITEDGASGRAVATGGLSFGKHEVVFVYDGGKRYAGKGVLNAVGNVNEIIAPALKGMDVTDQRRIDETIVKLDGTENKSKLGGNATASVSAASLKAAANSIGVPLYKYIGGVSSCILPVPCVGAFAGGRRYGGGERSGGKPSYEFVCYGFKTLSEAIYAGWEVGNEFRRILRDKFDMESFLLTVIPPGKVEHDKELWQAMTDAIAETGYSKKVGLQVDVAAGCYYDAKKDKFVGLFSKEDKTREDLIDIYESMAATFPFVVVEDPLDEEDYEGHAILTKELDIEVVGDDLFTTNIKRLQKGIEAGACNAMLLKVNQIGTISEAIDAVHLAYRSGYGVMPCSSRGEGVDIIDYTVGLGTGHMRGGGSGEFANRLMKIEEELGSSAKFLGKDGLKLKR